MLHHRDAELLVELLRRLVYNNLGAPNVSSKGVEKVVLDALKQCTKIRAMHAFKVIYNAVEDAFELWELRRDCVWYQVERWVNSGERNSTVNVEPEEFAVSQRDLESL